jgi:hypothetical protein
VCNVLYFMLHISELIGSMNTSNYSSHGSEVFSGQNKENNAFEYETNLTLMIRTINVVAYSPVVTVFTTSFALE